MKYDYCKLIQNALETTISKTGLKHYVNNKRQLQHLHAKIFNITKNVTEIYIRNNKSVHFIGNS